MPPERAVKVIGEVHKPGRYEWSDQMSLFDLIAHAGGSNHKGNIAKLKVLSKDAMGNITSRIFDMAKFIEQEMLNAMIVCWLKDNDLIIFDTSPLCLVNRRNIPAQLVAACCDGAILVVQSDKIQIRQLTEAMNILNSVNINLLGTMMKDYDNPCLGVELVRQCCKLGRHFPQSRRLVD